MSIVSFFKRLWGQGAPAAPPPTPAVPQRTAPPVQSRPRPIPAPAPAPAPTPYLGAMLRREEIMDDIGRLIGYRFSHRAQAGPQDHASAAVAYREALHTAQASSQAGRRLAIININPGHWNHADFPGIKGPHTVFHVHVSEQQPLNPDSYAVLKEMRACGAGLALSGNIGPDWGNRVWSLATHGFLPYSGDAIERFERGVKTMRQSHPHLQLAAEQVATWPERRLCMSLGVRYTLGDFLSSVEERPQNDKLSQSRIVLTEMLNLVRNEGDTRAIAEVAKRDPAVAVHLLSTASSAAYGVMRPITGIDQAIMILGRNALYRWLAVSVFRAGSDNPRDDALMEVALARARFLELTAQSVGAKQQADELFLVGLLSFIDVLLGIPLPKLVATMSLPQSVHDVLLDSQGPYVPYLMLAIAVEKCHVSRATQCAQTLGLPLDALNLHRDAALLWAEEAARR